MLPLELLGAPEGSCLVRACLDVENLTVHLAITAPTAACPLCGSDTRRVHSRYTRRLDDLPCLGRCVRLQVAVRRFVCPQSDCPRRIFAERLPGFAAPWARTTDRLRQTQTDIGSSLGGEAGCPPRRTHGDDHQPRYTAAAGQAAQERAGRAASGRGDR